MLTKALTLHQTHQYVLPSLPRACALQEDQDKSHRYQRTNCRYLDEGSPAEHFLPASQIHVWTVAQDSLVRECEVYIVLLRMVLVPWHLGYSHFSTVADMALIFRIGRPRASLFLRVFKCLELNVPSTFSQMYLRVL